jgi:hypothetical protein
MSREEGAELVRMLKEAIGVPESEAKGVVSYCSFVSTVVRRFNSAHLVTKLFDHEFEVLDVRGWWEGRSRLGARVADGREGVAYAATCA